MSRRPRRNHSPAFKAKVVLAAVTGEKTLAELEQLYDVHPNRITTWRTHLLERAAVVFGSNSAGEAAESAIDVKTLHAKIRELTHVHDFGPSRSARLDCYRAQNDDRPLTLPSTRQARELEVCRGSIYYLPRPLAAADLAIMRRIGNLHMEFPFAGSRMLRDLLRQEGIEIGLARSKSKRNRRWSCWLEGAQAMGVCYEHLSYVERLEIDAGRRARLSIRAIARMLNRAPSMISRELRRMGPYIPGYSPAQALHMALWRRAENRRGRRKLIPGSPLFEHVAASLREGWSPRQIAGRLGRMEDGDYPGRISHESIYTALYALPRGELRRELLAALRQGRQNRRPRSRGTDRRKGFVSDDIRIAERGEDVSGRLIPGHWEGDLIKGAANRSAVGTLVERTSRLVLLARMDGLDAATTRCAFKAAFENVPEPFRKSLTYDRGTEMARHAELTERTGIKIWFCDPYSPWQRGSNENANGLIRQYLPKGTDLSAHTQDDLNHIAERLNNRPRKVLNFETPNEVFARLVQQAAATAAGCCASG